MMAQGDALNLKPETVRFDINIGYVERCVSHLKLTQAKEYQSYLFQQREDLLRERRNLLRSKPSREQVSIQTGSRAVTISDECQSWEDMTYKQRCKFVTRLFQN